MPYVIKRFDRDGGGYVARPGSRSSYTPKLEQARTFETWEAADRERCPENERILRAELLIGSER